MAELVYIDETGSTGMPGAKRQPYLILAAVLVDEEKVQPLAKAMEDLAWTHLGWCPADFEFHGHELWQGEKHWKSKSYAERLAAYEAVIGLLDVLDLSVSHSRIDKAKLNARYGGAADGNEYQLALQFLLEKIDALPGPNRIVVADEAKHEQLRAKKMMKSMQQYGGGEIPLGRKLNRVIDSLHFVRSDESPGVQMADVVAFVLHRAVKMNEGHPDATAALTRLVDVVNNHTPTYRMAWPS